jgi:hypothetical protein
VFELEASGFTHVSGRCGGCGETITRSFQSVRTKLSHPALAMLGEIAPMMACDTCPAERAG